MQKLFLFLFLFFVAAPALAWADLYSSGSNLPPEGCVTGEVNILAWQGAGKPARCLHIPTCSPQQHLYFTGVEFICDGPVCPMVDPPPCGSGMHLEKQLGKGANGCPLPPVCVPSLDRCGVDDAPLCRPNQHLVPGEGLNKNGCPNPPRCVPNN